MLSQKLKGKVISLCAILLLFIIIAFWWPVYIAILHSDIGTAVVGKESSNWLNYNVRPFWYYWGLVLNQVSGFSFGFLRLFFAFNKKIENRNIFQVFNCLDFGNSFAPFACSGEEISLSVANVNSGLLISDFTFGIAYRI